MGNTIPSKCKHVDTSNDQKKRCESTQHPCPNKKRWTIHADDDSPTGAPCLKKYCDTCKGNGVYLKLHKCGYCTQHCTQSIRKQEVDERDYFTVLSKQQNEQLQKEMFTKIKTSGTEIQSLTNEIDQKQTEIDQLKQKVNDLTSQNASLKNELEMTDSKQQINDDYKELQNENNKLKQKVKSQRAKLGIEAWDYEDIVEWIVSIENQRFKQYEKALLKTMKEEQIDGSCLSELTENDFFRFGVKAFKDKKLLIADIKKLLNKSSISNDNNIAPKEEGTNITAYI